MKPSLKLLATLSLAILLSTAAGCTPEINLGPRQKEKILIVNNRTKSGRDVKVATIIDARVVKIRSIDKAGNVFDDELVLSGYEVIAPEPEE